MILFGSRARGDYHRASDIDLAVLWIYRWKNMAFYVKRNDMTHIYDGNKAKELVAKIIDEYIPAFCCM